MLSSFFPHRKSFSIVTPHSMSPPSLLPSFLLLYATIYLASSSSIFFDFRPSATYQYSSFMYGISPQKSIFVVVVVVVVLFRLFLDKKNKRDSQRLPLMMPRMKTGYGIMLIVG